MREHSNVQCLSLVALLADLLVDIAQNATLKKVKRCLGARFSNAEKLPYC